MGMTPQHFTPSLHLVPFKLPTMHTTNSTCIAYSHTINDNVLSFAHSKVFNWSISNVFSSSKISQHNLNSQHIIQTIYHIAIPYRPSTAHRLHSFCIHAGKTDHIYHAQYSNYTVHCSHPQHNPHQHALPALPTALPSTTLLCTQLTNTQSIFV